MLVSPGFVYTGIREVWFETRTCKGDLVVGPDKFQSPVLLSVTRSREIGCAVHEAVGDSNMRVRFLTKDVVYTASVLSLVTTTLAFSRAIIMENLTNRDMVNPDLGSVRECDRITTPDKLWVEVGDHDVLNNDVGGIDHSQPFAEEDTLVSDSDDRLVRVNTDSLSSSSIPLILLGRFTIASLSDIDRGLATIFKGAI